MGNVSKRRWLIQWNNFQNWEVTVNRLVWEGVYCYTCSRREERERERKRWTQKSIQFFISQWTPSSLTFECEHHMSKKTATNDKRRKWCDEYAIALSDAQLFSHVFPILFPWMKSYWGLSYHAKFTILTSNNNNGNIVRFLHHPFEIH